MLSDVELRRFCAADAPHLFQAARESIVSLSAWMIWCRESYNLSDSETFIAASAHAWRKREQFSFAIASRKSGSFLGSIGLSHINWAHKVAHLGYWVRTGCTTRGVATAAARQAARFAFLDLGLNRLELLIPIGNRPSRRVAEKLGALLEGVLRSRLFLNGQPVDAELFSVLRQDMPDPIQSDAVANPALGPVEHNVLSLCGPRASMAKP
jgi:ribosomal-protein-serine acetyltransferase